MLMHTTKAQEIRDAKVTRRLARKVSELFPNKIDLTDIGLSLDGWVMYYRTNFFMPFYENGVKFAPQDDAILFHRDHDDIDAVFLARNFRLEDLIKTADAVEKNILNDKCIYSINAQGGSTFGHELLNQIEKLVLTAELSHTVFALARTYGDKKPYSSFLMQGYDFLRDYFAELTTDADKAQALGYGVGIIAGLTLFRAGFKFAFKKLGEHKDEVRSSKLPYSYQHEGEEPTRILYGTTAIRAIEHEYEVFIREMGLAEFHRSLQDMEASNLHVSDVRSDLMSATRRLFYSLKDSKAEPEKRTKKGVILTN